MGIAGAGREVMHIYTSATEKCHKNRARPLRGLAIVAPWRVAAAILRML